MALFKFGGLIQLFAETFENVTFIRGPVVLIRVMKCPL